MFCKKCGTQISENAKFCSVCGNSVEEDQHHNAVQTKVKGINVCMMIVAVIAFLLMMLALLGVIPSIKDFRADGNPEKIEETGLDLSNEADEDNMQTAETDSIEEMKQIKVEGNGFDSPEEAVEAYIEALNNGDIDGMIACFAIESYVDNFDTRAHIERMGVFSPISPFSMTYELSDGSDFDREIRIKARQAQLMSSFYSMLSQQTAHHDGMVIGPMEGEEIDDFMDEMRESDFLNDWKNMKFVEFVEPEKISDIYYSEQNQKNIEIQAKIYGCEEIKDVCALVEIDGEKYCQFAQCGMYDGAWYIITCNGNLTAILGLTVYWNGLAPCAAIG